MALSNRQRKLYEDRCDIWRPVRDADGTTKVVGDETYERISVNVKCYFQLSPSQDDYAQFGRYERDIILTLDILHFDRNQEIDSDYIVKNLTRHKDGAVSKNYGRFWKVRGQARSFVERRRRAMGKQIILASATEEVPPGVS